MTADAGAASPGKQTRVDQQSAALPPIGLRSPRFAGDPTLEACYGDRARLTVGATGASVVKVQQALADLGYAIGKAGVDGIFGPDLWEAIKQFKSHERLGWETMGDVGPGTMHRLDALFADQPPPGRASADRAEDGGSTGVQDFVVTRDDDTEKDDGAVAPPDPDRSAILAMMMSSPEPAAAAGPGAAPAPTGHLSIIEAVQRFQSLLDVKNPSGDNVSAKGQFFWGRQVADAVRAEITAIRSLPDADDFPAKAFRAYDMVLNFPDESGPALRAAIAAASSSRSAAKPRMLALVHGFTSGGAVLEAELWAALGQRSDDTLPDLSRYRSLVTLRTLRVFDKVACTVHMLRAAERVKQKGGVNARDPKVAPFAATLSTGDGFRDRRPVDAAGRHRGDVVTQAGVAGAVAGLKRALDAGQMIHARVLSGVGVGTARSVPAEPRAKRTPITIPSAGEHSILIIGYDDNKFVFNDPDAGQSIQPAPGFGLLHFDGARLSTALDDDDLKVNEQGNHAIGDHRYQVLTLSAA